VAAQPRNPLFLEHPNLRSTGISTAAYPIQWPQKEGREPKTSVKYKSFPLANTRKECKIHKKFNFRRKTNKKTGNCYCILRNTMLKFINILFMKGNEKHENQ